MIQVGIDALSFHTSSTVVDLRQLAARRGVPPERYTEKLGQIWMAVPPPGEDIVTLGTNAARAVVDRAGAADIGLLLFATESAIDQSKAAGVYVHRLLGLGPHCRVVELKQACYGGTAALQLAAALVRQQPRLKALVIASDVARYGLGTPGEPTQGAGAAAFIVSAKPRLLALEPAAGYVTEDVMDFWRPNYRDEALVDGKASIRIYLDILVKAWRQYRANGGADFPAHARCCYHLPFTRMGEMAHRHLTRELGCTMPARELEAQIQPSLDYNRRIGNTYAASLYIALASLLDNDAADLGGQRLGLYSYGSGCVGEFFAGIVQPAYREHLCRARHQSLLARRTVLSVDDYEQCYRATAPDSSGEVVFPRYPTGICRIAAIRNHQRIYERCEEA